MDDVNGERPRFMGYEFLRFLEGYIKPEEVNTDAIHMVISLSLGLYFTCLRKTVGKKKKKMSS